MIRLIGTVLMNLQVTNHLDLALEGSQPGHKFLGLLLAAGAELPHYHMSDHFFSPIRASMALTIL